MVSERPVKLAEVQEVADDRLVVVELAVDLQRVLDQLDGLLVSVLMPAQESQRAQGVPLERRLAHLLVQPHSRFERPLGPLVITREDLQVPLPHVGLRHVLGVGIGVERFEQLVDDRLLPVAFPEKLEQSFLPEQQLGPFLDSRGGVLELRGPFQSAGLNLRGFLELTEGPQTIRRRDRVAERFLPPAGVREMLRQPVQLRVEAIGL